MRTDLKGAVAFGIECLFVTAGIHAEELGGRDSPDPAARLPGMFAAAGLFPHRGNAPACLVGSLKALSIKA